jgi:signal transduction protein with GAF and PtsI domain
MNASDPALIALDRIEIALDRLALAATRARDMRLAATARTADMEVRNERLREAVGEALGQIDTLIARVEQPTEKEA